MLPPRRRPAALVAVTVRARRRAPTPHQQPPAPRGAIRVRLPQHRQRGPRATSNSRVYTRLSRESAALRPPSGAGVRSAEGAEQSGVHSPLSSVEVGGRCCGQTPIGAVIRGSFVLPCTCAVTLCTCAVTLCTCAVTLQESCCNGASWVTESASGQAPSTPVFREKRSAPPPASPVEVGSRR